MAAGKVPTASGSTTAGGRSILLSKESAGLTYLCAFYLFSSHALKTAQGDLYSTELKEKYIYEI